MISLCALRIADSSWYVRYHLLNMGSSTSIALAVSCDVMTSDVSSVGRDRLQ